MDKLRELTICILALTALAALGDEKPPAPAPASPAPAAQKDVKANCQVKLVKEGSIEISFLAPNQEACLGMSEPNVEATYKQGTIERKRRGRGPLQ